MSADAQPRSRLKSFIEKFTCLRTVPRELWIIFAAYMLSNVAYKLSAMSGVSLWLSSDLGFNDRDAGFLIAVWSAAMTLVTVMVGSLVDAMGIRRTFLLGFVTCLLARVVMASSVDRWVALPGLFAQAVGIALTIPVMTAACKTYSNVAQRSVAFAFYYALMNLGYACGDGIFDRIRGPQGLGEHGHWVLPVLGTELSTYRVLLFISVLFTVPALFLVWAFVRDGVEMTEQGVVVTPRKLAVDAGGWLKTSIASSRETLTKTGQIFASLWREKSFYRFLLFMTLVVGVRMIFYHLAFTFPKYGIRELGAGAPFAHLSGMLNSVMIVVLVPVVGAVTQKISAYRMVTVGSLIAALSVFFIALPPEWFRPLADGWLGDLIAHRWLGMAGPVNPLYISIFFFIVMLSVGEAVYSPRLYEYSGAIAPKGQEASYLALSMLPFFAAKFIVGGLSGWLLEKFCPVEGPRHPEIMWALIGGMALITPVGTFVFRKYIQVHEAGREPVVTKAESAAAEEDALHE